MAMKTNAFCVFSLLLPVFPGRPVTPRCLPAVRVLFMKFGLLAVRINFSIIDSCQAINKRFQLFVGPIRTEIGRSTRRIKRYWSQRALLLPVALTPVEPDKDTHHRDISGTRSKPRHRRLTG